MSDKPANRILAALLSEQGRVHPHDAAAQTHVGATDHTEVHDLHRHDDDGGPGCPHDRRAAQEEARKHYHLAAALQAKEEAAIYAPRSEKEDAKRNAEAMPKEFIKSYSPAAWAAWQGEGDPPLYLEGNGSEAMPEVVSKSDHGIAIGHSQGILPTGYDERKSIPIATGLLDYFPKACAAVAVVSRIGNDQHNPGEPLHWARGKSMDQDNTAIRHFLERGGFDTDGARHTAKAAWRLLAMLELEIEADGLGLERKVS